MAAQLAQHLPVIELESLRVFRDRARVEVRPLTLLYGRNQAGKSTLLRLLPALADAIFGTTPVWDLSTPAFASASFKEMGWLGPEPLASPSIRLEAQKGGAFMEVQLTDDRGVVPNSLRIGSPKATLADISWAGNAHRSSAVFRAAYAGTVDAKEWAGELEFSSLLPTGLPSAVSRRVEDVKKAFEVIRRVQWLAATRSLSDGSSRPSRCCRADGSDLPGLLVDRKDVTDLATAWLAGANGLGEAVRVGKDASGAVRLELSRVGNEALPAHLAGEGARWLLPILLCACWAELGGDDAPTMLAIEEMEARLHPNVQIALLERLFTTIKSGIPCVLETHSIHVLRRAQLAVARKELDPKDVAVYWVERADHAATVRRVSVESDGTLRGWNPETFEEEQSLSREIFEARWSAAVAK